MRYRLFITARFLNIILILIFLLNESSAQGFLKAEGKRIVNAKGENVILRGEGFGGWMLQEGYMLGIYKNSEQHNIKKGIEALIGPEETEGFYDAWLHNFIQKIDIDLMHAWGFNSVRLPMHYNLYTLPVDQEPIAGQNTWLDKGFTMTDSLLAWCRANHIYLILDLHAAPGGQGNDVNISDRDDSNPSLWQSEANQEKTISLWEKLAERYKDEPWIGGYDILNEPNWGFTDTINDRNGLNEKWNGSLKKLMQKITAAIRQVDKNHMIIIEGNGWGNNYNGILPTWDNNMVLSFHKYWNYNRKQQIQQILDTRNNYNVPVWLGETGENSNVWFTEAIKLLEENNIGWSMWPLKKMGANNPLEIKSNPNYDSVRNFLNGHGPVPSANSAVKGLMELAKDVKLENNIFHKDVIDAMFRQPFSETAIPFHLYNLEENLTINAVDYDLGRNGVAYFDLDTADYHTSGKPGVGNRGHVYRNDGVDIYKDSSKNNTYYVGDIGNTEWLQYTIHVQKDGNYKMIFSYMPGKDEGKLSVIFNGKSLLNEVTVPAATDNENKWQQLDLKNIHLDSGTNRVRIYAVKGGFKLENIQFLR